MCSELGTLPCRSCIPCCRTSRSRRRASQKTSLRRDRVQNLRIWLQCVANWERYLVVHVFHVAGPAGRDDGLPKKHRFGGTASKTFGSGCNVERIGNATLSFMYSMLPDQPVATTGFPKNIASAGPRPKPSDLAAMSSELGTLPCRSCIPCCRTSRSRRRASQKTSLRRDRVQNLRIWLQCRANWERYLVVHVFHVAGPAGRDDGLPKKHRFGGTASKTFG